MFKNLSFEIKYLPWTSNTGPYWQNPTSKHSIKVPPLTTQNFNGNPLKYHEWINKFFCLEHNNISITDTRRITYLQNAKTGKRKDVIQAYSCEPAFNSTALNDLMSNFGSLTLVWNAFINQLKNWKSTHDYNKQNFVASASFWKRLVQAFQYLGYTADLQSSTLMKKAEEKKLHNIFIRRTEHTTASIESPATLVELQKWLEVQAHVYDSAPPFPPLNNAITTFLRKRKPIKMSRKPYTSDLFRLSKMQPNQRFELLARAIFA